MRSRVGPGVGVTALATATAVLLRLPFLGHAPYPDEGGLLIVAEQWHGNGPWLYGHLFVDRPPLLLLFWKLALELGGLLAARLLTLVAVAMVVVVAGRCGHLLGGRRGTTWSVAVAAALVANPTLGVLEVNAELLGAPLTLLACLALVTVATSAGRGRQHRRRDDLLVLLAGTSAAGALLMKQSLADGLVFGAVLATTAGLSRQWPWRRALRVLVLGVVGAAVPLAATALWAATRGPGLHTLWYTLYQFRIDASAVIVDQPSTRTQHRLGMLVVLAVVSGIAVVALPGLWALRERLRRADPVTVAIVAMLGYEIVAVALGGSYWPHYLLGLVPGIVLLVGAAAGSAELRPRAVAVGLVFVVGSALVVSTVRAAAYEPPALGQRSQLAGWLRDASLPGDTGTVTYGHADILEAADLTPRYPYLWSLPMRTLDPRLDRLVRQLNGHRAPTWVIRVSALNSWDLDPHGRVQRGLDRHYVLAATVCGVPVFLHADHLRPLPAPPLGCTPAT